MENNFKMIATTFYGMEEILAKELLDLGAQEIKKGNRSISFKGDKDLCIRLMCKNCIKILKPIFSKRFIITMNYIEFFMISLGKNFSTVKHL